MSQLLTAGRSLISAYRRYLGGMLVRQVLMVLGGYALVWMLKAAAPGVDIGPVWLFVAALLLFDAGMVALDTVLARFFADRVSLPLFRQLRVASLRHLLELPLEWHQQRNPLELTSKLNSGAGRVVQTAEVLGRELLPALIRTTVSLIPLLLFSAATTPLVFAGLAAFLWLAWRENQSRRKIRHDRHEQYAQDAGLFTECVQNVQPLAQFGQTGRMLNRYDRLHREIELEASSEVRMATRWGARRNLLISATRRLCQGIWIWQYQRGTLDAPTVMYLSFLTEELIGSFWSYATVLERVFDGVEPARVLIDLHRETSSIQDQEEAKSLPVPAQVGIHMDRVDFGYNRLSSVLRNFSLNIAPGEIVGLVGRSGIGKTTIQSLLQRLFDVRDGSIRVAQADVREWRLAQLRGLFASVSQNGAVFFSGWTIEEILRFGRPGASDDDVREAAVCACIHEEIMEMPDGYRTVVGTGGATVSKGQAQRLGLAQALVALHGDRKILILDEFTSALDAMTEARVLDHLRPRLKGCTVLIIAHRLATVRRLADRIVVIEDGGVLEQGTHTELVGRGQRYAELVGLQSIA